MVLASIQGIFASPKSCDIIFYYLMETLFPIFTVIIHLGSICVCVYDVSRGRGLFSPERNLQ